MAAINTLVDNFNDNTVDTGLWPNNYGTYQETGGQAQVACTTSFSGYRSAPAWTLTGSSLLLQMYPPPAAGAGSATSSMFITSTTAGTDAGFLVDTVFSAMGCYLRVAGSDPAPVFLTYNPTSHAWLRVRETAGTLYWETSPDATTWTIQRTATTPAWAPNPDLALVLEAHRDAGTNNFAAYDNVNVPPGQTIALSAAGEIDTAQAVSRTKSGAATQAAQVDTGQNVARAKRLQLGCAIQTSTAQAAARTKTRSSIAATSIDTAQPIAGRAKNRTLGPAGSLETALQPARTKTWTTAAAGQTAIAIVPLLAKARHLTPAGETAQALGIPGHELGDVEAGTVRARWTAGAARSRWHS